MKATDDLAACRGLLNGVVIGAVVWLVVLFILWGVLST